MLKRKPKPLPLFTCINGKYIPLGSNNKPLLLTKIDIAINKYIEICSQNKSIKNCKTEILYFNKIKAILYEKNIEFVSDISRENIDLIESIFLKSMKTSSVNRRFKTFSHFFNKCYDWHFVSENPCDHRSKLKEKLNPRKVWSRKILELFLNECDEYHKKVFTFMWMTGCRQSELLNLKWSDIDYGDDERLPGLTFTCGKNANLVRPFPLVKEIDQLLHTNKLNSLYVFSNESKKVNTDNLYQYAKTILKRLGLNDYTPYGLRHSFASRLAAAGVNSFYIAYLMGHQNYSTTRNYIHFDEKVLHEYVSKAI